MAKKESLLINDAKRWLRRASVRLRQSIAATVLKRDSAAAVKRLTQLPEYRRAKTVAGFIHFGSEVRTDGFMEKAWKDGKNVVIPMCERGFDQPYFALFRKGDKLASTAQGPFELVEKRGAFPLSSIDFVVVPGLAFDHRLHRLGYGGGVYDRLLAKTPHATHVGLFLEVQRLAHLPISPHDKELHAIVTEKRVLRRPRH
jgi:5-formyltetrahydrofolate cyclo-ligase